MSTKSEVLSLLETHRGEYISGGEIARMLNLSRNSVWKAVRELQNEGYVIDAKTNAGYSLTTGNDILSAEGILPFLRDKSVNIQVFPKLDSTNNYLKKISLDGAAHGTVIIAETQTGGRGRRGREFYSPASSGLYISLLLRPKQNYNQALIVTSAVAVAVAEAIERVAKDRKAEIKWVNDLYLRGRKICGILTEAATNWESGSVDYIILGIGINVSNVGEMLPDELNGKYGAIFERGEKPILRNRLAGEVISCVMEIMSALEEDTDKTVRYVVNECRARSCVLGKKILIQENNEIKKGLAVDLDEHGFLIVEDESGRRTLSSGEISIRF